MGTLRALIRMVFTASILMIGIALTQALTTTTFMEGSLALLVRYRRLVFSEFRYTFRPWMHNMGTGPFLR